MRKLWGLLCVLALLVAGIWLVLSKKQKDPEPRLLADIESEQREGPQGWETLVSGVQKTLQPYLSPVTPRDPEEVAERWIAAPQEMRTGPSKMKLRLSTEWVYTVNSRSRTVAFVPLRGVKTGKDFVREVERVKRETGAMVQLVFTEKDADPSPENRIVLTERLYLKNPSSTLERQMVKELGLKLVNQPNYAPGIKIYAAGDALQALASLESLRDAAAGTEPTPVLAFAARLAAAPNDPLYPQQWHLKATNQTSADGQVSVTAGEDCNVESVWGYPGNGGYRGRGINIAILDNGVDLNHPDLVANLLPAMYHYDFLFPIYDQSFYGTYQSVGGGGPKYTNDNHGTAVAGVAAAQGNNSIGVTGVAPEASLISYRILGSTPYPNQFNTWTPTDFNGAALSTNNSIIHIKNNSWGYASYYHGYDNLEAAALQNARSSGRWSKGTIVVFAAMNELMQAGRSDYYVHISDIGTIGVAALDHTGGQAAYSNPGSSVLVAAPSGNWFPTGPATTTTDRTGGSGYNSDSGNNNYTDLNYTATFNGTSSASPVVSGVVALMLEANPNLKWRDVQEILLRTARKNAPSDSGWTNNGAGFRINDKFGFGCVDAAAAVQLASGWTNNLPGQWKRSITNSSSGVIGNNDGSVLERQFTVSASSKIRCESVTVTVNITHPSRGDLRIELVSPAGTVSTLAAPYTVNGAVDDLGGWTFRTVRNWGERDAGTWTLRVRDQQAGESGPASLDSAVLEIYGVNATSGPLPPAFLRLASGATVSEHAAISTVAAVVESSDENGSDVISLVPGEGDAHNGYFEVSGKNLVVKQDIDFNNLSNGVYDALSNTYSLKVRLKATDPSGQYSLERAVLLPVLAQNDYPPLEIYLQDYYGAFGVRSGHKIALLGPINSGAPLGKFCAFDQDRPDLGGDQLAYTLVGGVGADDNSKFSIAGDTLSANTSLAPLTLATYKIRVRATDNGGSMIEKPFLIFQTPANNRDFDGDSWDDYLELVSVGHLALNPWQDNDGDGFINMFDPRPLESPWTQNGVKLSNEWLGKNVSSGLIWASDLATVASLYDDRVIATYALVAGEGDQDNGKFQISGNKLYVNGPVLGSQQATYRIRVQATRVDNPFAAESDTWTTTTTALVLSVVQDPDEDSDSLPDAWEIAQFGNLDQGPWGDADGDGCPNRLEYVAGSDATNAAITGSTGVRLWGSLGLALGTVPQEATNLVSIVSGPRHMLGIASNGTVVAWGQNYNGESSVPAGLTNVIAVAAGGDFSGSYSLALKADGTVVGWGRNDFGQAESKSFLPLKVKKIAAGATHVVALLEDGTLRAWGSSGDGQTDIPASLSGATAVSAGFGFSTALGRDGSVSAWGLGRTNNGIDGNYGQAIVPANLTNALSIASGDWHTTALKKDGTVVVWGNVGSGLSTIPSSVTNIVKVASGNFSSFALRGDGVLIGWGDPGYGSAIPEDLSGVVDFGGGMSYGAALTSTVTTQAPPNRAPTDISLSLSGGSVPESTTFGSTIGLLVVTDPDLGDTQSLSLVSGTGDSDNWMVQVSGMSLLLNTTLNYEFKSSLSIRVRTTDSAGNTLEKSFTVPVGNVLTDDDDYDGLTEAEEIAFGTNPNLQDTDGDGYLDYAEKMAGTAGNSAQKVPNEIKDFMKFQTMATGPETRSFVFFTRMNHKHTVKSSTDLVNWTNDGTIYPTNPFIGTGRHTNMSIYTYSPRFFVKIITESNTPTTSPPTGGGGGGGMPH